MLAKVKETISTPSNTFILFNQWDRVEEDGEEQASHVKQQQLSKVTRIMAHELNIFTEEMAKDRTFFVSAKQAVNNADGHVVDAQQTGSKQADSSRTPVTPVLIWCTYICRIAETEAFSSAS